MAHHAHAWKSMQSTVGQRQEDQHRLTRLADGREAVQLGTRAQQTHVIKRFEEEISKTPQRKKLFQEAIDAASDSSVELTTGVDVSPSSQVTEEDHDVVFAREIELAMKLSLEANELNV